MMHPRVTLQERALDSGTPSLPHIISILHPCSRSKERLLTEIGSLLTEIAFLKEVREQLVSGWAHDGHVNLGLGLFPQRCFN